ncbi:MAG: aa3-type cytochrome oxidase subunit CtaJ [Thermocrispum sp.]
MSVIETILIFAVIPAAVYGVVGLFTLRSKFAGTPRYRPGQEWDHPPMWWSANPQGLSARHGDDDDTVGTARMTLGGARGSW